jgi:hypothetical protein
MRHFVRACVCGGGGRSHFLETHPRRKSDTTWTTIPHVLSLAGCDVKRTGSLSKANLLLKFACPSNESLLVGITAEDTIKMLSRRWKKLRRYIIAYQLPFQFMARFCDIKALTLTFGGWFRDAVSACTTQPTLTFRVCGILIGASNGVFF